ncbi:MAG TPA: non-heme iron oxygenase ferredoxin subunit [Chromatiales bacterium]|nr:non-heme iron oxygenase ferredoxin subunit [Chromatiales bacterium]
MSSALIKIAEPGQCNPGQMLRVKLNRHDILLANVDGTFYAIDNQCSHEDASLYNGALKGDCVECPLHGSLFRLRTGQPEGEPATEPVHTYALEVRPDGIYLDLAE